MSGSLLADFFACFSIKVDQNSVNQMTGATQSAENSMRGMKKSTDAETHALLQMKEAIVGVSEKMEFLKKAVIGFLFYEVAHNIYEAATEYQNAQNMIENATGSEKMAVNEMKQLVDYATKWHLKIDDVTKQFGSFNLALKEAGATQSQIMDMYQKINVGFTGAHITGFERERSMADFINDVVNVPQVQMGRIKNLMLSTRTGLLSALMKKTGATTDEELGKQLNAMNKVQRLQLISNTLNDKYMKGAKLFTKSLQGAANNLSNTLTKAKVAFTQSGFGKWLSVLFNTLSSAIKGLTPIIQAIGSAFGFISPIISAFGFALEVVIDTIDAAIDIWNQMPSTMKWILGGITAVTAALLYYSKVAKVAAIFTELLTSPILLIGAAVAAVILIIQDIITYLKGGQSVTGSVIKSMKGYWNDFAAFMKRLWNSIYNAFFKPFVDGFHTVENKISSIGKWLGKTGHMISHPSQWFENKIDNSPKEKKLDALIAKSKRQYAITNTVKHAHTVVAQHIQKNIKPLVHKISKPQWINQAKQMQNRWQNGMSLMSQSKPAALAGVRQNAIHQSLNANFSTPIQQHISTTINLPPGSTQSHAEELNQHIHDTFKKLQHEQNTQALAKFTNKE
ncbi:Phage-related protein (plasmid) [Piscirickettsia salmonis]|uniref:tape measure protein n=1 Tax=Piscirickettsia salmonis TaxID=1238 RepID=UPI0012BA10A1|nr:tape measure protein [Piscirickettsia salmonis]QGP52525.1 Phage-related protein [Piscirickettsia salmonis]